MFVTKYDLLVLYAAVILKGGVFIKFLIWTVNCVLFEVLGKGNSKSTALF